MKSNNSSTTLAIPGKFGVCCTCQQSHPIEPNPSIPDPDDIYDDPGCEFVMAPHSMYGDLMENPDLHKCDGAGTVPQTVHPA